MQFLWISQKGLCLDVFLVVREIGSYFQRRVEPIEDRKSIIYVRSDFHMAEFVFRANSLTSTRQRFNGMIRKFTQTKQAPATKTQFPSSPPSHSGRKGEVFRLRDRIKTENISLGFG